MQDHIDGFRSLLTEELECVSPVHNFKVCNVLTHVAFLESKLALRL